MNKRRRYHRVRLAVRVEKRARVARALATFIAAGSIAGAIAQVRLIQASSRLLLEKGEAIKRVNMSMAALADRLYAVGQAGNLLSMNATELAKALESKPPAPTAAGPRT